ATLEFVAFAIHSSAAKRRDFDPLSQRRQVLFEDFFSNPLGTQRATPARPQASQPGFASHLPHAPFGSRCAL
ncbi:hypothetical protein, partial [Roseateles sp.]|uniref:hypothetical protein n=1 Tax=Roseateles sp. TaxID=1971397 RepID=UPI0025E81997